MYTTCVRFTSRICLFQHFLQDQLFYFKNHSFGSFCLLWEECVQIFGYLHAYWMFCNYCYCDNMNRIKCNLFSFFPTADFLCSWRFIAINTNIRSNSSNRQKARSSTWWPHVWSPLVRSWRYLFIFLKSHPQLKTSI